MRVYWTVRRASQSIKVPLLPFVAWLLADSLLLAKKSPSTALGPNELTHGDSPHLLSQFTDLPQHATAVLCKRMTRAHKPSASQIVLSTYSDLVFKRIIKPSHPSLDDPMQIQDLPLDIFKSLLQHVALALGVEAALRVRLVSKVFANEMLEAVLESGGLDEVTEDALALHMGPMGQELRITRCPDEDLKARYLYSRTQHKPIESTEFVGHLRLIAAKFVSKSGDMYDYDTSLRTLCDVVIQTFNLSRILTDNPMFVGTSGQGYSPDQACLNVACGLGDLGLVSTLLKEDDIKINPTEPQHFLSFPIRVAVRGGHKDVVDYLLQRGSRIEADGYERGEWTVIHDSVLNREPAMLELLLDKKLEFPVREQHAEEELGSAYEDALITAAYQDNDVAFNMLLERGPIKAPLPRPLQKLVLMAACEGRSMSIARSIFDMDPLLDPNYDLRGFVTSRSIIPFYKQRQCPLQAAAHWGSIPLVDLLLKHGADPNWSNGNGKSALYSAASNGYDRCKDMLLCAGADPDELASLED